MVYAHLQLAQDKEARAVIDEMVVASFNPAIRTGPYAVAASQARYMIERNDWKGAAALVEKPTRFAYADAVTHFARALGAARSGNLDAARTDIAKLAELRDKLVQEKDVYWSEQVDIQRQVATAWVLYDEGKHPGSARRDVGGRRRGGQDRKVDRDAGAARTGPRTLRRDAAGAQHGQGGVGGI